MSKSRIGLILFTVLLILIAVIASTSFYRVNQGEEALVLTFGKVTDVKEAGLYWKIPFIQSVQKESVTTIHTMEYGFRTKKIGDTSRAAEYEDVPDEAIMLTGDGNIVTVEVIYQYTIEDVKSFLYQAKDPIDTLKLAFETVLRRNVQSKTIDDALLNKQEIANEVFSELQNVVNSYGLGIKIRGVEIQNIQVPQEVSAAYEDVNNAKNEKTRKLDEAEKYKNEKVPAARANAYETIEAAEAYKAEKIAQALGDVANFEEVLNKYLASKEITKKRLFIETMENILSKAKMKYIVDDSGEFLKFLPIEPSMPAQASKEGIGDGGSY